MASYTPGDLVPWHVNPGVAFASYAVSFVGAATTVELLHRRPEGTGPRLWLHRFAVAVSFGLVGIWCMHFVGNRAIIMGEGSRAHDSIQLVYSPTWTAVSAILPITCLFIGFAFAEGKQPGQRGFWPRLMLVGLIAGAAVCGMHYVGNLGIYNYKVFNDVRYVVSAAVIAEVATVIALSMFFHFQDRWLNSLPRRLSCAVVLALAVSGMHWVATVGTSYQLLDSPTKENRNTNLIVAIVMCLVACLACLVLALSTRRRKKQLANRVQHVTLSSVLFDYEGNVLVTREGLFPSEKITDRNDYWFFNDTFTPAHWVFQRLYRMSRYWPVVVDYVPFMRAHLQAYESRIPGTSSGATESSSSDDKEYCTVFIERFVVASINIADRLETDIDCIGVLADQIMPTGSIVSQPRRKSSIPDLEAACTPEPPIFGKGQALFLTGLVDESDASDLLAAGYRFASITQAGAPTAITQVGDHIARTMQVSPDELIETCNSLRRNCLKQHAITHTGTSVAFFGLRAAIPGSAGGLDVMVLKEDHGQLPQVQIMKGQLNDTMKQYLINNLEGRTFDTCLEFILSDYHPRLPQYEWKNFLEVLLESFYELQRKVPEKLLKQAVFTAQTLDAAPEHTAVIAFYTVMDIHTRTIKTTDEFDFTPMSLFRCRQRVYKNSPDRIHLAQELHREYSGTVAHPRMDPRSASGPTGKRSIMPMLSKSSMAKDSTQSPADSSSERGFGSISELSQFDSSHIPMGNIMMTQHITVDNKQKGDSSDQLQSFGNRTEINIAVVEEPSEHETYADKLLQITCTHFGREKYLH